MCHSNSVRAFSPKINRGFPFAALLAGVLLLSPAAPAATGDPDSFNAQLNFHPFTAAVQSDRKILIAGPFSAVASSQRIGLARYSGEGAFEAGFNPAPNAAVYCTAAHTDGKTLLGGIFGMVGGVARTRLARVNADGTLDSAFDPAPDSAVNCIVPQPDGRILIGGGFTSLGGLPHTGLARLNADGTVDTNFTSQTGGLVNSIAVQADGKILVGGSFGTLSEIARHNLGRLNADGTLDLGFNPGVNSDIHCLAVQADGKILVGGVFTNLAGATRNYIGRLNPNGTLDTNFNPNASASVGTLALQADGSILIGGTFVSVAGVSRTLLARLDTNGVPDPTFNPVVTPSSPPNEVFGLALQADGRILMAGQYNFVNGQNRGVFARLLNDPATQSLTAPAFDRVEWLRGGTAPEAQYVSFELSTNGGATYALLGHGTRMSGGWTLTGLSLPAGGALRARAGTIGGRYNGSSGLIETISSFGPLAASNRSAAQTYTEDTPLNLTDIVIVSGSPSNITATLTLSLPDAGSLSTATSGVAVATYTPVTGVWSATGSIADINALLAEVSFRPATNFNADFTIATSLSDGITTLTGSKAMAGVAVNDPPTLAPIGNPPPIQEDPASAFGVALTGISAGGDEVQTLTITATSGNTNLIASLTINYTSPNPSGSLNYRPVANANGTALITLTINDGGLSNNLTTQTFTITVTPVNDVPTFTKGPNKSHPFGTTNAQTFVGWATGIDDGDAGVTQALTFIVTNSNPGLFTTAPGVAADGTLTYTPKGTNGVATLGVSLRDDGTAGGVTLTTPVQIFTITVNAPIVPLPPVIDLPSLQILGNGSFQFSFTNTNNVSFSVLATTNISLPSSNWTVLGVTTGIGGGLHQFTDLQATNSARRFYRLRFP